MMGISMVDPCLSERGQTWSTSIVKLYALPHRHNVPMPWWTGVAKFSSKSENRSLMRLVIFSQGTTAVLSIAQEPHKRM
jgi:hypothetical protein